MPGPAELEQAAAVGVPAKDLRGRREQEFMARPPAVGQDLRHAPLKIPARIHIDEAFIVQQAHQRVFGLVTGFPGLCLEMPDQLPQHFAAQHLRALRAGRLRGGGRPGRRCFFRQGSRWRIGGRRARIRIRGLFRLPAFFLQLLFHLLPLQPPQQLVIGLAQFLEGAGLGFGVDPLQFARVGAAHVTLVRVGAQLQPREQGRCVHQSESCAASCALTSKSLSSLSMSSSAFCRALCTGAMARLSWVASAASKPTIRPASHSRASPRNCW
jgi:hypothetical protein